MYYSSSWIKNMKYYEFVQPDELLNTLWLTNCLLQDSYVKAEWDMEGLHQMW